MVRAECIEKGQVWLLSIVGVIYFTILILLIITGTTVGILAKKEAKRIEYEYETHPEDEDDYDPLDDIDREDLADVYETIPDDYLNKTRDGYDSVSTLQDFRDNSLDYIAEEESENTDINSDQGTNSRKSSNGSASTLSADSNDVRTASNDVKGDRDNISEITSDSIPYMDDSTNVSDSEASIKTVIEVKKSIRKTNSLRHLKDEERRGSYRNELPDPSSRDRQGSSNGDLSPPEINNERRGSSRRESLALPFLPGINNERRGSNRRESLALPPGTTGERRGSNRAAEQLSGADGHRGNVASNSRQYQSRFDMKKIGRKISNSTIEDSSSLMSSRSRNISVDSSSSFAPSESSIVYNAAGLIVPQQKLTRSNSANKAAFVLRLLSRPEEYEEGISEFKSKPKELRSPTGRKISEANFKIRLSIPDVGTVGRSMSNSSGRCYTGKDTLRSRSPMRGHIERDPRARKESMLRNRSLDGLTTLTGTLSKQLGKRFSRSGQSIDENDSVV